MMFPNKITFKAFGLFILLNITNFVYSQTWQWGLKSQSGDDNYGVSICNSINKSLIVTGRFIDTTFVLGTHTLTGNGLSNFFLAKYDSAGNVLWIKNFGGVGTNASCSSVKSDKFGNIYIGGIFSSTTIAIDNFTLSNAGIDDGFLAKFNSNGNAIWAKNIGGNNYDYLGQIGLDSTSNIYVTGEYNSSPLVIGTQSLYPSIGDIFIAKFDTNGNPLWAKSAGGAYQDTPRSLSVDAVGNCYITGMTISDSLSAGSLSHVFPPVTSGGQVRYYLLKYNNNGVEKWLKTTPENGNYGNNVITDKNSNLYVSGDYFDTHITFGNITLVRSGSWNGFLIKYDSTGNALWAKSIRSNSCSCNALETSNNYLYVCGNGDYPIFYNNTVLNSPVGSTYPSYILKLDLNGNVLCTTSINNGAIGCLSADKAENLYLSGFYILSPLILGTYSLSIESHITMFLAKYTCCSIGSLIANTSDSLICIGSSATLSALGAITYSWNNGTTGQTTTVNPVINTTYTLFGIDAIGCTGKAIVNQAVSSCLDVPDRVSLNNYMIYPNPMDEILNIECSSINQEENTNVIIMNALGQIIHKENIIFKDGRTTIKIKHTGSGIYVLKLSNSKGLFNARIIIP